MAVELNVEGLPSIADAMKAIGNKTDGRMLIEREKGKPVWIGKSGPDVDISRAEFARKILRTLNKEIWLDGMWAVSWVNWTFERACYTQVNFMFLDKDMDLQFVVTSDEPIEELWNTVDERIDHCLAGYLAMKEQEQLIGVNPGQKIKAALGQASADKTADPGVDMLSLD